MDPTPEQHEPTVEQEIIKSQYEVWHKILAKYAKEDLGFNSFRFYIDRNNDQASLFNSDSVYLYAIDEDFVEYCMPADKASVKDVVTPNPEEKWMAFEITPQNPYKPEIRFVKTGGKLSEETGYYLTPAINIFISNLGNAIEFQEWRATFVAGEFKTDFFGGFFEGYTDETIPEANVDLEGQIYSKAVPLTGQSIERLSFITQMVKTGNFTAKEN